MDDYTREMMDLKTLVTRTLEKKGVLAKIRVSIATLLLFIFFSDSYRSLFFSSRVWDSNCSGDLVILSELSRQIVIFRELGSFHGGGICSEFKFTRFHAYIVIFSFEWLGKGKGMGF